MTSHQPQPVTTPTKKEVQALARSRGIEILDAGLAEAARKFTPVAGESLSDAATRMIGMVVDELKQLGG